MVLIQKLLQILIMLITIGQYLLVVEIVGRAVDTAAVATAAAWIDDAATTIVAADDADVAVAAVTTALDTTVR